MCNQIIAMLVNETTEINACKSFAGVIASERALPPAQ
jgi:hypothetical protein